MRHVSLKSLDPDYSSKNHVRKFFRALPLKWRAKVTTIEEAKDLATLPLDELVGNLKVYEIILENDGVVSKTTTKDKVKSLAFKANITRGQTSNNNTCQDESDEDEEINLMAKNFRILSRKGVKVHDKFDICQVKTKGGKSSRREHGCYNCGDKNHLTDNCLKPNNKAFIGVTWSDSEDGDEPRNDATCLMENQKLLKFSKDFSKTYEKVLQEKRTLEKEHSKLFSKVNELELEVKKLASNKEVIEPCQKCVQLTQVVDSLKSNVSKLQDETLNFSKFKKSSIVLDDMLSCQKLSQDKKGLGFYKNDKTTSNHLMSHLMKALPKSRTSPLVDDEIIEEQAIQNYDRNQNPNCDVEEVIPRVENIREVRDHPIDHVIGELDERTLRSHAQDRTNFFAFVSTIKPKNIKEAIKDKS
ncbi:protein CHUP1, chloroplastic [Tanacetum coccineum]